MLRLRTYYLEVESAYECYVRLVLKAQMVFGKTLDSLTRLHQPLGKIVKHVPVSDRDHDHDQAIH